MFPIILTDNYNKFCCNSHLIAEISGSEHGKARFDGHSVDG